MCDKQQTSIDWDDDERSLRTMPCTSAMMSKRTKANACNDFEEYISVTSIMKDFYKEERDMLYATSPEQSIGDTFVHEYDYNDTRFDDESPITESSLESIGDTDDHTDYHQDEEEVEEERHDTTAKMPAATPDMSDIIDNAVYKKFSYV